MSKEEVEWIDKATGYTCLAKLNVRKYLDKREVSYWCGYVAVPDDHPLSGKEYHTLVKRPADIMERSAANLQKGPMALIIAAMDLQKDSEECELMSAIDVHGGLTFASRWTKDGPWYFGFDCDHINDTIDVCDLKYVKLQCTSLAAQLKEYA